MNFFRKRWGLVGVILLSLVSFLGHFPLNSYVIGGDAHPFFYTTQYIFHQIYIWSDFNSFGGVVSQPIYLLYIPLVSIIEVLKITFGDLYAQFIFYGIIHTGIPIGMYLLSSIYTKKEGARFFGALMYGFSFLTWLALQRNVVFITFLFLITPYASFLIYKFINRKETFLLILLLIIGFFNAVIVSNPWTFIIQFICLSVLFISQFGIKKVASIIKPFIYLYIPTMLGIIVLGIFLKYNNSITADEWNNVVLKVGPMNLQKEYGILLNSMRGYTYDLFSAWGFVDGYKSNSLFFPFPMTELYKSLPYQVVGFVPVGIIIVGLIFFRTKKLLFLVSIYIVTTFIFKSVAEPFGFIMYECLEKVPLCSILRNPQQKVSIILLISIVLSTMVILEYARKKLSLWLYSLILIYLGFFSLVFFRFPIFSTQNIVDSIPSSYEESANFINNNPTIKKVLILPFIDSTWTNTNFGYEGYPLFLYLLNHKQVYNRNDIAFSSYANYIFKDIGPFSKKQDDTMFLLLRKYNIDTVIFDGYTDQYRRFQNDTQNQKVEQWLRSNDFYKSKKEFGNIQIFQFFQNPTLVGVDILEKVNPTQYSIADNIKEKNRISFLQSFHPQWKLYLEPYNEIDCKNPTTYSGSLNQETETYSIQSGDDYPKIVASNNGVTLESLRELNPDINEGGLKIGQVITLKKSAGESYNVTECESENRFYVGGELSKLWEKPIFDDTHTMVYDYANQWTIDPEYIRANYPKEYYKENPDGSIDVRMTLYFKPQSYFYLGLIISGSTLILLIGYLGYSIVRIRKAKKQYSISQQN